MGRGVEAGAVAGVLQDRRDHGGGGALAFGAGDVDGLEAVLRVAEEVHQAAHAVELEIGAIRDVQRPLVVDTVEEEVGGGSGNARHKKREGFGGGGN